MPSDSNLPRAVAFAEVANGLRQWRIGSDALWAERERQLDVLCASPASAATVDVEGDLVNPPPPDALDDLRRALVDAAREQLGSIPHTRTRRVGVSGEFDGLTLRAFLLRRHPHVPIGHWIAAQSRGDLVLDGRVVQLDHVVRAGALLEHREDHFREPEVATEIRVLWADHTMWVVDKPAPLPVHPCGRFGHNTFTAIAQRAVASLDPRTLEALEHDGARFGMGTMDTMPDETAVRPVHRLDADTRGLLVVARSRVAARMLTRQWEAREVVKLYRARVTGDARRLDGWWQGDVELPSTGRVRRVVAPTQETRGREAITYVRVVGSDDDYHTTDLLLSPWSGRTNQLRVHLAALGFPIVGDDDHASAPRSGLEGTGSAVQAGRSLALTATHLELTHPFDRRRLRFVLA